MKNKYFVRCTCRDALGNRKRVSEIIKLEKDEIDEKKVINKIKILHLGRTQFFIEVMTKL